MARETATISLRRRRMVEDATDAYVAWREESARVWDAYERSLNSGPADAVLAFRAYLAALDREERASEVYADLLGQLQQLIDDSPRSAGDYVRRPSQRCPR